MKFLTKRTDGGPESNVTGYWLIEWKGLFSIVLLKFSRGSRDKYHSHAFWSISWLLKGGLLEDRILAIARLVYPSAYDSEHEMIRFRPSWKPIITTRDNLHKVHGMEDESWVLSFRGPWTGRWEEYDTKTGVLTTLTHGRKVINPH